MVNFNFIRICKKAVELNKSLRPKGVLSVSVYDGSIQMSEKGFLAMFPTYPKTDHSDEYVKYSTTVSDITFFCLVKENKEVA